MSSPDPAYMAGEYLRVLDAEGQQCNGRSFLEFVRDNFEWSEVLQKSEAEVLRSMARIFKAANMGGSAIGPDGERVLLDRRAKPVPAPAREAKVDRAAEYDDEGEDAEEEYDGDEGEDDDREASALEGGGSRSVIWAALSCAVIIVSVIAG